LILKQLAYLKERAKQIASGNVQSWSQMMDYYSRIKYDKKQRTPIYSTEYVKNYDSKLNESVKVAKVTIEEGHCEHATITSALLQNSSVDRLYIGDELGIYNHGDINFNGGNFKNLMFKDLVIRRLAIWDMIDSDTQFIKMAFRN